MKNRWSEAGAREARERWAEDHGDDFALRLYTARLIGEDTALVLHGGGNVSLKGAVHTVMGDEVEAIYVKASGSNLASLTPEQLPAMDLTFLRRLRTLERLDDDEMVNQFRTHLFEASAPTPSIETLVHAFLPHRFIDHSHAGAILTLTNQPEGAKLIRDALGDRVAVLPYIRPGFELAKACADVNEAHPNIEGIVLLFHGLITFADDARTSYERHIALVDTCEQFISSRAAGFSPHEPRPASGSAKAKEQPNELATRVAPILRGLLARSTGDEDHPYARSILEWRPSDVVFKFMARPDAKTLVDAGPLTGDHIIRTKPKPLLIDQPQWSDEAALRSQLEQAIQTYRQDYDAYAARHGSSAAGDDWDSYPIVVLLPEAGMFCQGLTKRDACIAADIAEHTLEVKADAQAVGRYDGLSEQHVHDMEFRAIQRAKLGEVKSNPQGATIKPGSAKILFALRRPLAGQVVAISGGAGAIGFAVAEACIQAGAHVALADLDSQRLERIVGRLETRYGVGIALGVVMDVTDESSVRDGFARTVQMFGGVDVVVLNAGIAHVAPIEELEVEDFRRVMDVNATGYLLFMREGIRVLKRQRLGGHIIINASKNVFGPGKDFGAYSASKAAGHQLGKVAAIELAPQDIRVNMINADAIFGDREVPSGLWAAVGPDRARSRGMTQQELIEYYRNRNLLRVRIHGRHVGNAVVFFAANATPTTGATLPVDGGIIEAFPR